MKYKIKQGTHSPFRFPKFFFGKKSWEWDIKIHPSAYTGKAPDHISKLIGIGFMPGHHKESVRLGWMESKNQFSFDLYAYWYEGGKRMSSPMVSVHAEHGFKVGIVIGKNETAIYVEQLDGMHKLMLTGARGSWLSYLLRPYYGGTSVAPCDMVFEINKA